MTKDNFVAGIDIATTKVAVSIGQIQEGMIKIIGLGKAPTIGLRRGLVVDVEETVSSISAALEIAEQMAGVKCESAFVGIGGSHISSLNSRGVIAVSRADGEISPSDLERVIDAARAVAMPPNREILHVIPKSYTVDGQEAIKNPLGMTGIRLEVETQVIGGSTNAIRNLTKCINQSGLKIDDLIFTPLATAKALLSRKQKEIGVVLADLGAGTTSFVVFEEGDLIHAGVLPVGAAHLTNDIAIGLRTSIENAEKIKLKYGHALAEKIKETEIIEMVKYDPSDQTKQSRRYVAEIIEARLTEIFSMLSEQLKSIGKDGMLPAGIVFTGGGSKLSGLVDSAKENLRLPAQIGHPVLEISGIVDKLDDEVYASAVGLTLWGLESKQTSLSIKFNLGKMGGMLKGIKDFVKQFLP